MNDQQIEMSGPLSGKKALITGSAGGVGFASARALAQTGADLYLSGIGAKALERSADEIRNEFGVSVETHIANTANYVDAQALAMACDDVNVFVNCTGNIPTGSISDVDSPAWNKAWEAAVNGPINMVREMWPGMVEINDSMIIIIVDSPNIPNPDDVCASAAGGALMSLVEAMGKIDTGENNSPRILGLVTGRGGDGAAIASAISRVACSPLSFKSGSLLSPDAINASEAK